MNIEELIRATATRFDAADLAYGHGTGNALDEAAWLVFDVMQMPHDDAASYQVAVSDAQQERVESIATARIERRVPLAYLLKHAFFAGHRFYVDERVLVPRSPIAELIHERFSPWVEEGAVTRALDLGTGSGCIAIALAHSFTEATVDAADISKDALDVAMKNVDAHQMANRVTVIESNYFDQLDGQRYDLIVSNPPYVDADDILNMPEEFSHEPEIGLASGNDGLDAIRQILRDASRFLTDNGILVAEVGNSEAALVNAFPTLPFVWLDFEHGGSGVFLLAKNDLEDL